MVRRTPCEVRFTITNYSPTHFAKVRWRFYLSKEESNTFEDSEFDPKFFLYSGFIDAGYIKPGGSYTFEKTYTVIMAPNTRTWGKSQFYLS